MKIKRKTLFKLILALAVQIKKSN